MIYCIEGKILEKNLQYTVLFVNGVGYKLNISLNTYKNMKNVEDTQFLYTFLYVREDALELFGFSTKDEKDWFKLLTSISGIGPKVAVGILSDMNVNEIISSILNDDFKSLTKCSGIGTKTAQRVVLELKDKVKKMFGDMPNKGITLGGDTGSAFNEDVYDALTVLGYQKQEIIATLSKVDTSVDTSEIIKQALKLLSGKGN